MVPAGDEQGLKKLRLGERTGKRLADLRESGIVELDPSGGYRLTASGRSLLAALAPLDAWAKRWAGRT